MKERDIQRQEIRKLLEVTSRPNELIIPLRILLDILDEYEEENERLRKTLEENR